ncbi:hypothetical protein B0H14DRAFT_3540562 [Mycena olivaceomarginata]|nr:hypothetical protein B0H14DRAFT_3540562 [Mycena olivaceomarginata]
MDRPGEQRMVTRAIDRVPLARGDTLHAPWSAQQEIRQALQLSARGCNLHSISPFYIYSSPYATTSDPYPRAFFTYGVLGRFISRRDCMDVRSDVFLDLARASTAMRSRLGALGQQGSKLAPLAIATLPARSWRAVDVSRHGSGRRLPPCRPVTSSVIYFSTKVCLVMYVVSIPSFLIVYRHGWASHSTARILPF